MGKKPQRHSWQEAEKLCSLDQNDIEMARKLGFTPDSLIRAIPSRKQGWKLPVREWVRNLHFESFGHVLGEKRIQPAPVEELGEEAQRQFEEELYWEARNDDDAPF
jgi:hypothetical protein